MLFCCLSMLCFLSMAMINTRVVRRSLALRRQHNLIESGSGDANKKVTPTYNESQVMPNAPLAFLTFFGLIAFFVLLIIKPTRELLKRFVLPKPGEGPSEESRRNARFTTSVIGRGANGQLVEAKIQGTDPGYTETAVMVGENGLLLAYEREQLPLPAARKQGGFFTPSVVGGMRLVERLRGGGLKITVGEFKQGN